MSGKTLYDKLWESHLVRENEDGTSLLYIDRQLIHEVTSPQAFEGMRLADRPLWRTEANVADSSCILSSVLIRTVAVAMVVVPKFT